MGATNCNNVLSRPVISRAANESGLMAHSKKEPASATIESDLG